MKILTIFIIAIIIIILILGVVYFYYKHEKPLQERKIIYRNVNIRIFDIANGKNVISNYTISLNDKNNYYKNSTSLKNDYILEKLPENSTFHISSNIQDTRFYNDYKIIDTYKEGPFRVDLELTKRGNLSFNYFGDFDSYNTFDLTINKEGELRDLKMCYLYSTKIIALYNNNSLSETSKLDDYKKYYRCYVLPEFNSTLTLNFNFLNFGNIDKYDYIDFLIMDSDISNSIHKEFFYNVTI